MAEQAKRNWKIWALVGVLVLAGGGYVAKTMIEKKMVSDIETFLANLPAGYSMKAESIKVDALSKSAVLTKITGSGKLGESGVAATMTADSAEASGLNLKAFKEKGVTTLADSLVVRNLKINGGDLFDAQIGMYQIDKMQGDFVALAEQSAKVWSLVRAGTKADMDGDKAAAKKASDDLIAAFKDPAFFSVMETMRIGKAVTQNYTLNIALPASKNFPGGKFGFLVDSSEAKDYAVGHSGPAFARGLKVTMNGAPLLSLDEMSLQGMDIPHKEMAKLGEGGTKPAFKELKLSLQDLRLKKLDIVLPTESKDAISMVAFGLSFTMEKGGGALALKVDQLDMPTALLIKDNPMALTMQDLLPKRILLDKDVDVVVTPKDKDVADVNIKKANASVKDLGAVAISGDVLDIAMAGGRSDSLLRKMDISVTDSGVVKVIFAARALMEGDADPEALRSALVAQIEAQGAMLPNQQLKDVAGAAASFLKQPGGTVRLTVAPEKPVSTREARMLIMREPEKLGISSSFTPGK